MSLAEPNEFLSVLFVSYLSIRLCIAQQNLSIGVNVVSKGSPSRILRVLLISLGITILPKSSTLLTSPVAVPGALLADGAVTSLTDRGHSLRSLDSATGGAPIAPHRRPGHRLRRICLSSLWIYILNNHIILTKRLDLLVKPFHYIPMISLTFLTSTFSKLQFSFTDIIAATPAASPVPTQIGIARKLECAM